VIAAADRELAQIEAGDDEHIEAEPEPERRERDQQQPGSTLAGGEGACEHGERCGEDDEDERHSDGGRPATEVSAAGLRTSVRKRLRLRVARAGRSTPSAT
jgi:hypothetical protein